MPFYLYITKTEDIFPVKVITYEDKIDVWYEKMV